MLIKLKNDQNVTTLVPENQIYSQQAPAEVIWPFIKLSTVSYQRTQSSCVKGGTARVSIHCFAKPKKNAAGSDIDTAEDQCSRIINAIEGCFYKAKIVIDDGYIATDVLSPQILPDGAENDAFHGIVDIRAEMLVSVDV